jgi:uncharacterized protein YjbJ (UPF0337 family)
MNKHQVRGVADKVKGKVRETVGRATGNREQELKGDIQQGSGHVEKAVGDAKERTKKEERKHH